MRKKNLLGAAIVALGTLAPIVVGTGTASAAPGSDLDLTQCSIVDDPVNYGDGIDWFKLHYTMVNEGSAPSGNFTARARPVWGTDMFSGTLQNEAHLEFAVNSLSAGESRSGFYWVTKKVVDQRTWGIFLDVNHVTGESQTNDSFCSFFVNNT